MGMRIHAFKVMQHVAVLLAVAALLVIPATRAIAQTTLSAKSLANLETEVRLQKSLSLSFDEEPFQDVMGYLSTELGVNMVHSWSAKNDLLSEDELVELNLKNVPASSVLDLMLSSFNATYLIEHGTVVIISKDDGDDPKFQRQKVFDCRKLIESMPEPIREQNQGGFPGGFGKLGKKKGGGVFCLQPLRQEVDGNVNGDFGGGLGGGGAQDDQEAKTKKLTPNEIFHKKCEHLQDVIQSMTNPDSWYDMGGSGEIKFVNGILLVRQSEITLRQVEDLLVDLHAKLNLEMPESKQKAMVAERVQEQDRASARKRQQLTNQAREKRKESKPKKPAKDPFEKSKPDSEDANPFG